MQLFRHKKTGTLERMPEISSLLLLLIFQFFAVNLKKVKFQDSRNPKQIRTVNGLLREYLVDVRAAA